VAYINVENAKNWAAGYQNIRQRKGRIWDRTMSQQGQDDAIVWDRKTGE
jgi:hypothetical protein